MNTRPQLTFIHFDTPELTWSSTHMLAFTSTTTTVATDIYCTASQWWKLLSKFEKTSFILNTFAISGIVIFVCYLFMNKHSRKIKGKKLYINRNGAPSYGF